MLDEAGKELDDEATTFDELATTEDETIEELVRLEYSTTEDETNYEDITDEDTITTEDELDEATAGRLNSVITVISTPQLVCLIIPVELPRVESSGIICRALGGVGKLGTKLPLTIEPVITTKDP